MERREFGRTVTLLLGILVNVLTTTNRIHETEIIDDHRVLV